MNFIAICLHCLDMRDFHSNLRDTPFLDKLRKKSIFTFSVITCSSYLKKYTLLKNYTARHIQNSPFY